MIPNYFRVIEITIEKIIIGNTQPAQFVPRTSPEGPLKVLTPGTYRGPSETLWGPIQTLMILWKNCFSEVIVLVIHICICFLQEEQIFKSSKRGRSRDVYGTELQDVHGTKWWDVLGTSLGRQSKIF